MPSELLAPGSVLLQVGPYKTGPQAIAHALSGKQDALGEHGVAYLGEEDGIGRPGWAVTGWAPEWLKVPVISEWEEFARTVRDRAGQRVCVSTEDIGGIWAPDLAQRVVEDLGGANVHVVYVCRALHRLLPSQWQEWVKSRIETHTYEDWLRSVLLPEERDSSGEAFWVSHDLDRNGAAWAGAVGPGRFHVIATDDSDRALLSRTFESMLGLPAGLLDTDGGAGNESFPMNSMEMLRRLNVIARERGWPLAEYMGLVRNGAFPALRTMVPSPLDEAVPALPDWAHDPVAELGERRIDTVRRLGADVIGDPDSLRLPADLQGPGTVTPPARISMDAAVAFTGGLLERDHAVRRRLRRRAAKLEGRPMPSDPGGDR